MAKRLLTLIVALALSVTLKPILAIALQNAGPQRGENQNQQLQDNQKRQATPDTGQRGQPQNTRIDGPITIQGPVNVISEPSADQKQREAEDRLKPFWQKPEWVGIFVGGIAALFAFLAWRSSNEGTKQATRQADAAVRALALTERSRLQLIEWSSEHWHDDTKGLTIIKVTFFILNSGRQQAKIHCVKIENSAGGSPMIRDTEYILPRKEKIDQLFRVDIPDSHLAQAVTNRLQIRVEIDHSDAFTRRIRHFAYDSDVLLSNWRMSFGPDLNYEIEYEESKG